MVKALKIAKKIKYLSRDNAEAGAAAWLVIGVLDLIAGG